MLLFAIAALIGAGALAFNRGREPAKVIPAAQRPMLLLLTSLPLLFGEDFSLESGGSAALTALRSRYSVVPISVSNANELAKGRLLLMAQPSAQTAENLVALDAWVRRGGRVMLLADPMLEWSSTRPLGDALRPAPMFADTGLLAHWGLRLDSPENRGPAIRKLGEYDVNTASPGSLWGRCRIGADRFAARCRIGRGQVTIVADADLLDTEQLDGASQRNLDAVLAELSKLASK